MPGTLEALMRSKHVPNPSQASALDPGEMEALIGIAEGARASENRPRAIDILAASRSVDAIPILARILLSERQADPSRRAAAAQLGRLGGGEAEMALIHAADQASDAALLQIVGRSLMRCGTARARPALERLARWIDPAIQSQARFASMVIAFREGEYGRNEDWDEASLLDVERQNSVSFRITQAEPDVYREARDWIARDIFGIDVAPQAGLSVSCGRDSYIIFFNGQLVDEPAARLADRAHLAAFVAQRNAEDESFFVRWLVLTVPKTDKEVACGVFRLDGVQVLRGWIHDGRVDLSAVMRVGAVPTHIVGKISRRTLRISSARVGLAKHHAAKPSSARPPSRL